MVADLTANDGKTTLLAYLVQLVKLKAPELSDVVMKGVQRAHSKANLPALRPAVHALEQQVNDGLAEVTAAACSVLLDCVGLLPSRSATFLLFRRPFSMPNASPLFPTPLLCACSSLCLMFSGDPCVTPAGCSQCPDVELWGGLAVESVQAPRAVQTRPRSVAESQADAPHRA